jgi:sugar phosphate isomerase/epimerase
MLLGYNTNGMAHHDLFDAVRLLADIGYQSIAITIDHNALSPHARYNRQRIERLRSLLEKRGLRSVIETGARFLLDPNVKHEPTLITADPAGRRRRIDFYRYAIDCAAELGSDCVSLWSGRVHGDIPFDTAMDWLADGLIELLEYSSSKQVSIGFEPEPGMLIDSMHRWNDLLGRKGLEDLCLTLDLGHVHCQGDGPIAQVILRWASRMVNVHIEDMRAGVHEHLMFGEGELDFPTIFASLSEAGYAGGVHVELSRHSHDAPAAARKSFEILTQLLRNTV